MKNELHLIFLYVCRPSSSTEATSSIDQQNLSDSIPVQHGTSADKNMEQVTSAASAQTNTNEDMDQEEASTSGTCDDFTSFPQEEHSGKRSDEPSSKT